MIKLLIFILMFAAIILLAGQFLPVGYYFSQGWKEKNINQTSKKLEKMFFVASRRKVALMVMLFPLIAGGLGLMLSRHFLGLLVGVFVGAAIPSIVINKMEERRRLKFQDQLVDGLMIVSSSLKAGLSLLQAIETLAEEMPAPISQEFGLLLNECRMGVPFEEAAAHLKQRVHVDDLDMVVTSILVARETGGDLTEVFSQLVFTIREKAKIERRVRTLTVQGRLQGWIMALLPIIFSIFIYKAQPDMFETMLHDKMGRLMLIYAAISQVVGIVVIRKLSKVEV